MIFAATPYGQQLQRESEATETVQAAAQAQATAEAKAYALAHPKPTVTATSTPAPTSMAEPTAGTARATVDASAPVAKADGLTRPEAIRRFIERG